jgi:site-specific recombinase XerD
VRIDPSHGLGSGDAPSAVLRVVEGGQDPARDPDLLKERLAGLQQSVIAASTRRAYLGDWRHFAAWCERHRRQALPAEPEAVALYLADYADRYAVSTLTRRLVSIAQVHVSSGHDSPTRDRAVRDAMRGVRRRRGTAQQGKAPLLAEDVRRLVDATPADTTQGKRDRLILLLGFATARTSSTLRAESSERLSAVAEGLVVTVRRSKTDQEGRGRRIGVPKGGTPEYCPAEALRAWLSATGIRKGPLLIRIDRHRRMLLGQRLSGEGIAIVVKRAALRAGLDPAPYGGHSLRAGLATSAAIAGASYAEIKKQTGHKSDRVLERYIRDADLFRTNAAKTAGL